MKFINRLTMEESDFTEINSINLVKEWIWQGFNAYNKEVIKQAVKSYVNNQFQDSGAKWLSFIWKFYDYYKYHLGYKLNHKILTDRFNDHVLSILFVTL